MRLRADTAPGMHPSGSSGYLSRFFRLSGGNAWLCARRAHDLSQPVDERVRKRLSSTGDAIKRCMNEVEHSIAVVSEEPSTTSYLLLQAKVYGECVFSKSNLKKDDCLTEINELMACLEKVCLPASFGRRRAGYVSRIRAVTSC